MLILEKDEKILYTARKHWFVFVAEAFSILISAFIPLVFFFIPTASLDDLFNTVNAAEQILPLATFLWSLWLMLMWAILVLSWTDFYLDVWLVTTHRIVDVEQVGLFNRRVSSFRFDHIQDASVKISGLLATIIDFGTVEVRTASDESFTIKGVAHPKLLKEAIMSEHHRVYERKS